LHLTPTPQTIKEFFRIGPNSVPAEYSNLTSSIDYRKVFCTIEPENRSKILGRVKRNHDPENPLRISQSPHGINADLVGKPILHDGDEFEFCPQLCCTYQQILLPCSFSNYVCSSWFLAKARTAERRKEKEGEAIFCLPGLYEFLLRNDGGFTTCFQPPTYIDDRGLLRSFSESHHISSLICPQFGVQNLGTHLLPQSK